MKSQEEWLERTQKDVVARGHWRDNLDDFYRNDFNEIEDTEILKFLPKLKEKLFVIQTWIVPNLLIKVYNIIQMNFELLINFRIESKLSLYEIQSLIPIEL